MGVGELDIHTEDESGALAKSSGMGRRHHPSCSACQKLSTEVRWTVGLGLRADTDWDSCSLCAVPAWAALAPVYS